MNITGHAYTYLPSGFPLGGTQICLTSLLLSWAIFAVSQVLPERRIYKDITRVPYQSHNLPKQCDATLCWCCQVRRQRTRWHVYFVANVLGTWERYRRPLLIHVYTYVDIVSLDILIWYNQMMIGVISYVDVVLLDMLILYQNCSHGMIITRYVSLLWYITCLPSCIEPVWSVVRLVRRGGALIFPTLLHPAFHVLDMQILVPVCDLLSYLIGRWYSRHTVDVSLLVWQFNVSETQTGLSGGWMGVLYTGC